MRRVAACVALAASMLGAVVAHAADGVRPRADSPPRVVMTGYFSRVPIELIQGTPVIQVEVNGHGPFRFAIDTGHDVIALSAALAESLGLSQASTIDSIAFGTVRLERVRATPMQASGSGIDGLLGLPAFDSVLMTIEYARKQLVVVRDSLPPADGMDILAMHRTGTSWTVPLQIGDRTFDSTIDTGSMDGIDFALADTSRVRWSGPLQLVGRAGGPGAADVTIYGGVLADDATLGRHVIQKPFARAHTVPGDGAQNLRIGSEVLQNFIFTLDQAHGRARFMRSESDPIVLPDPRNGPPPGTTGGTTQGKRGK